MKKVDDIKRSSGGMAALSGVVEDKVDNHLSWGGHIIFCNSFWFPRQVEYVTASFLLEKEILKSPQDSNSLCSSAEKKHMIHHLGG